MKSGFSALIVGLIFSLGLGISGMTNPQKIYGFLNIFGQWDPSLMFVMIGSILVHSISYQWIKRRPSPLFGQWPIQADRKITPRLVFGAVIFGCGWGLAGYCPGPAIVSAASLQMRPIIFVGGMLGGMFIFKILNLKVLRP